MSCGRRPAVERLLCGGGHYARPNQVFGGAAAAGRPATASSSARAASADRLRRTILPPAWSNADTIASADPDWPSEERRTTRAVRPPELRRRTRREVRGWSPGRYRPRCRREPDGKPGRTEDHTYDRSGQCALGGALADQIAPILLVHIPTGEGPAHHDPVVTVVLDERDLVDPGHVADGIADVGVGRSAPSVAERRQARDRGSWMVHWPRADRATLQTPLQTRAARSWLRRTLPASSRSGSFDRSTTRGTLYGATRWLTQAISSSSATSPASSTIA